MRRRSAVSRSLVTRTGAQPPFAQRELRRQRILYPGTVFRLHLGVVTACFKRGIQNHHARLIIELRMLPPWYRNVVGFAVDKLFVASLGLLQPSDLLSDPRAAVSTCPLQDFEAAVRGCRAAGTLVPWAAVSTCPLQDFEVTSLGCIDADPRVARPMGSRSRAATAGLRGRSYCWSCCWSC